MAALRAECGWTRDVLSGNTGIGRASLPCLEHGELSPTAAMLNRLCAQYGWTASRLRADAETAPPTVPPSAEQITWKDLHSGYIRRAVAAASEPKGRIGGNLSAGAAVSCDGSWKSKKRRFALKRAIASVTCSRARRPSAAAASARPR